MSLQWFWVALRRTVVMKGQSELCQKGSGIFFLIAVSWQCAKEPSVFLACLADCGSAWDIPRTLYLRLLEGFLDCSRLFWTSSAWSGATPAFPGQEMFWDGLWLRKRAAGWNRQVHCLGSSLLPEKCAWLSFLIPRNHNLHLTVFTKGTYPMSLDTQESRLLILASWGRQAGLQIILLCMDACLKKTAISWIINIWSWAFPLSEKWQL